MVSLDGKHAVLDSAHKLITVGFLFKAAIGSWDGRVGARFHTNHKCNVMQAVVPEESAEATEFVLQTLAKVLLTEFGIDVRPLVVGVCADHAGGFQKARMAVFPNSVRALDFFHVVEAHKDNMHGGPGGKLRNIHPVEMEGTDMTIEQKQDFAKKFANHVLRRIENTRHAHNPWLFHIGWVEELHRVEHEWGARECADYLFKHRLTLVEEDMRFLPKDATALMAIKVNGKEYAGRLSADWHASIKQCPPMAASGTACSEREQKTVKECTAKNARIGDFLANVERRMYGDADDLSAVSPKPAPFPQEWNFSLIRRNNEPPRPNNENKPKLPVAEEYYIAWQGQKRETPHVKEFSVKKDGVEVHAFVMNRFQNQIRLPKI